MRTQRIPLLFLLCFMLPALVSCGGFPVPAEVRGGIYLAKIDRVEPEIPGLIVEETTAVVGAITVINETGRDIYIYSENGSREIKITSSEVLGREKNGQWVHLCSSNKMPLGGGKFHIMSIRPSVLAVNTTVR